MAVLEACLSAEAEGMHAPHFGTRLDTVSI